MMITQNFRNADLVTIQEMFASLLEENNKIINDRFDSLEKQSDWLIDHIHTVIEEKFDLLEKEFIGSMNEQFSTFKEYIETKISNIQAETRARQYDMQNMMLATGSPVPVSENIITAGRSPATWPKFRTPSTWFRDYKTWKNRNSFDSLWFEE